MHEHMRAGDGAGGRGTAAPRLALASSLVGMSLALVLFAASLAFLVPQSHALATVGLFGVGWLAAPVLHVRPLPVDVATALLQVAALALSGAGVVAGVALGRSPRSFSPAARGAVYAGCLGLVTCALAPLTLVAALAPWSRHGAAPRTWVVAVSLVVLATSAAAMLYLWRCRGGSRVVAPS